MRDRRNDSLCLEIFTLPEGDDYPSYVGLSEFFLSASETPPRLSIAAARKKRDKWE